MSISLPPEMLEKLLCDGSVPLDDETIIISDGAGRSIAMRVTSGNLSIDKSKPVTLTEHLAVNSPFDVSVGYTRESRRSNPDVAE